MEDDILMVNYILIVTGYDFVVVEKMMKTIMNNNHYQQIFLLLDFDLI